MLKKGALPTKRHKRALPNNHCIRPKEASRQAEQEALTRENVMAVLYAPNDISALPTNQCISPRPALAHHPTCI